MKRQIDTQTFTILNTSEVHLPFVLDIGEYSLDKYLQVDFFVQVLNELIRGGSRKRILIYWLHDRKSEALIYRMGDFREALRLCKSGEVCTISMKEKNQEALDRLEKWRDR